VKSFYRKNNKTSKLVNFDQVADQQIADQGEPVKADQVPETSVQLIANINEQVNSSDQVADQQTADQDEPVKADQVDEASVQHIADDISERVNSSDQDADEQFAYQDEPVKADLVTETSVQLIANINEQVNSSDQVADQQTADQDEPVKADQVDEASVQLIANINEQVNSSDQVADQQIADQSEPVYADQVAETSLQQIADITSEPATASDQTRNSVEIAIYFTLDDDLNMRIAETNHLDMAQDAVMESNSYYEVTGNAIESAQVDDQLGSNVDTSKPRSRKRMRQPENWKNNIRKRRRQSGLEYINTRGILVPEKILTFSSCSCPQQCSSKVPAEEQEIIFQNFKSMGDRNMQAAFIAGHVVSAVKKKSTLRDADRRKTRTNFYRYYLTLSDNRRVEVCKKFFVGTLPVGRKTVEGVAKNKVGGMAKPDGRGKKPSNKKSESVRNYIRQHIGAFPAVESHYCRANSTKTYLDANLNIRKMYRLYCKKCMDDNLQPENEKLYRTIFNTDFNISFHHAKKDECNFCTAFKNSAPSEKALKQLEYTEHHARIERVRQLRNEHKQLAVMNDTSVRAVTFDLQQVLQSPSLSVGALYYKRKLNVYNQTVYNLADHNVDCFVWHEGTAGRGSCEMASCLYQFMKTLPQTVEHLILYSDTCGGQNRNINFSSMCLYAVSVLHIKTIDHIYMESGHSQMECDSVHSTIEKAKKNVPVYAPMDYYTVIRGARHKQPYLVHTISQTDFLDFNHITKNYIVNRSKTVTGDTASWTKMKWIQYKKEAPAIISFKYDYDEPFQQMRVTCSNNKPPSNKKSNRKRKVIKTMPVSVPLLFSGPVPISDAKYADLKSLCDAFHIPSDYHSFYNNLLHTASAEPMNDCEAE
jgi:hypothetical protein